MSVFTSRCNLTRKICPNQSRFCRTLSTAEFIGPDTNPSPLLNAGSTRRRYRDASTTVRLPLIIIPSGCRDGSLRGVVLGIDCTASGLTWLTREAHRKVPNRCRPLGGQLDTKSASHGILRQAPRMGKEFPNFTVGEQRLRNPRLLVAETTHDLYA